VVVLGARRWRVGKQWNGREGMITLGLVACAAPHSMWSNKQHSGSITKHSVNDSILHSCRSQGVG
jgi:hypothetical protein